MLAILKRFARNLAHGRMTMAATPPLCNFGEKARDFTLPATDGRSYGLGELKGPKGTVVVFMCNHCPYVKTVIDRLIRDARDLQALGVLTYDWDAEFLTPWPARTEAWADCFPIVRAAPTNSCPPKP